MIVLLVGLEMVGKFVDAPAEQRNLDRSRTRVGLMCAKVAYNLFFYVSG